LKVCPRDDGLGRRRSVAATIVAWPAIRVSEKQTARVRQQALAPPRRVHGRDGKCPRLDDHYP